LLLGAEKPELVDYYPDRRALRAIRLMSPTVGEVSEQRLARKLVSHPAIEAVHQAVPYRFCVEAFGGATYSGA